jgi:hypothetical protein
MLKQLAASAATTSNFVRILIRFLQVFTHQALRREFVLTVGTGAVATPNKLAGCAVDIIRHA